MLLASMGLKAGCPDLILEFKNGKIVYIELKSKKGTLSKAQKLWHNKSIALKTPHYILKANKFSDLQNELDNIITKHYKT